MSNITIKTVVAAAVATNGTITFTYPAGVAQGDFVAGGEVLGIASLQNVLAQAADTFTVSYGSTSATVTYKDATSIPAGSELWFGSHTVDKASADNQVPAATTTARGGVKQAVVQAASTASDAAGLVTDFNALLTKLKAAGVMASA